VRPELFLGNFDKKIFPVILQRRLESFLIDLEGTDPLEAWYNLVTDSAVLSGAVMYDSKSCKKYADNNTVITVPYNKSKSLKKHKYNLW